MAYLEGQSSAPSPSPRHHLVEYRSSVIDSTFSVDHRERGETRSTYKFQSYADIPELRESEYISELLLAQILIFQCKFQLAVSEKLLSRENIIDQ